jgi:hypothetical protein
MQYLFHFPLRNIEQATKKIFNDRLPRFTEEERKRGWHVHYDEYVKEAGNRFELFNKYELLPISDLRVLTNKKIFIGD